MTQQQKIAVIGAGTMGARIAAVFAASGFLVGLYSRTPTSLEKAKQVIALVTDDDSAITYTTSLADCLRDAIFVSENVAEQPALKQAVLREIEQQVSRDCLITTNTSSISIGELASGLQTPARLVGMHWFNPANIMPLIEIVRGPHSDEHCCQQVADLCQRLGKETVMVNQDIAGFIVNRLQYAMLREALHLVTSGTASIADVDHAVETTLAPRWSAMGPMKLMDFAGLDTVRNVAAIVLPTLCNDAVLPDWLVEKVAQGQLGAKSGAGFYPWSDSDAAASMQRRDAIVSWLISQREA